MTKIRSIGTIVLLATLALGVTGNAAAQSQSWFKQIKNGNKRFKVLTAFNKEAVLDKETGLVWRREPSSARFDWDSALATCHTLFLGNRLGWRAPTIEELASLVDRALTNPTLANNHPFSNIQNAAYWSSTTYPLNDDHVRVSRHARTVSFSNGSVLSLEKTSGRLNFWCVRGGQGLDGGVNQN